MLKLKDFNGTFRKNSPNINYDEFSNQANSPKTSEVLLISYS
jgi:hypothetical protein